MSNYDYMDISALERTVGRRLPDERRGSGPVITYQASLEQMAMWAKEREERMAKRAEIVADKAAGMSAIDIAKKHRITTGAVYDHIRRDKEARKAEERPMTAVHPDAGVDDSVLTQAELITTESVPDLQEYKSPAVPSSESETAPAAKEPSSVSRRPSKLRPTAFTGAYASYAIEDEGVRMEGMPDPAAELLKAEQLRGFAYELLDMADVLEGA